MVDVKSTQHPDRPPDNTPVYARKTLPPDPKTVCDTNAATDPKTTTQAASPSISTQVERSQIATSTPVYDSTFEEKGINSAETQKKRNRTFAEIIADDLRNRNIIEIIFTPTPKMNSDGEPEPPKQVPIEDQGEFLFEVLKLEHKNIKGVNLFTNKKEINLEPHFDPSSLLT